MNIKSIEVYANDILAKATKNGFTTFGLSEMVKDLTAFADHVKATSNTVVLPSSAQVVQGAQNAANTALAAGTLAAAVASKDVPAAVVAAAGVAQAVAADVADVQADVKAAKKGGAK